jgi:hypothetical protein
MAKAPIKELLFGRLALSGRLVTDEQIAECLELQRRYAEHGGPVPRLGELLARVQTLLRRMKPCSGASCGGEAPPGRDEASESDNSSCSRGGDANVADN